MAEHQQPEHEASLRSESEADGSAAAREAAGGDPEQQERIEEIQQLALAGDLEAPAGAEELVEALVQALRARDENHERLLRALADEQNLRRRAAMNAREATENTTQRMVESFMIVLDHFDMALSQNPETTSAEAMFSGVRTIRDEMLRLLARFEVQTIEPTPNDEFDPRYHEAVASLEHEGVEAGAVATTYSVGYRLGDRVIRAAKVVVAK